MLCLKCIFLLNAVMLLLDFASTAPTFVAQAPTFVAHNAAGMLALKADKTRPYFYDPSIAPIHFRRLRRHLAQMFVGNHHYNHHTHTSKPVTRRPHSRRHGDRAYGEFRLAQA